MMIFMVASQVHISNEYLDRTSSLKLKTSSLKLKTSSLN